MIANDFGLIGVSEAGKRGGNSIRHRSLWGKTRVLKTVAFRHYPGRNSKP
ncbi:hypothetical protein O9992_28545 [Vibrio lentus]|nr:hypothetical protein [Vibrio lentus]